MSLLSSILKLRSRGLSYAATARALGLSAGIVAGCLYRHRARPRRETWGERCVRLQANRRTGMYEYEGPGTPQGRVERAGAKGCEGPRA